MEGRLTDQLQDCLQLLHEGASLEECLARYPDDADELAPLLRAAAATSEAFALEVPLDVRSRVRGRVLAAWDQHEARARRRRWQWRWSLPGLLPRWTAVAASLVLVVLFGGAGTVVASANALPGDPLYPVKELREEARVWLTRSPEERIALYSSLVKERVSELKRLVEGERAGASAIAVARLEQHLAKLDQLADTADELESSDAGTGLSRSLAEAAVAQRDAAAAIHQTLEDASEEARPSLQRALEVIEEARGRVDAALDTLKQREREGVPGP